MPGKGNIMKPQRATYTVAQFFIKPFIFLLYAQSLLMVHSPTSLAQDMPKAQLEKLRIPANIKVIKEIRGPIRLTRTMLAKLYKDSAGKNPWVPVDDFSFPNPEPLDGSNPGDTISTETKVPSLSPTKLKASWLVANSMGTLDPQIAVSSTHVMITTSSKIACYSKSGSLLQMTNTKDFFSVITSNINTDLNMPANLQENIRWMSSMILA
jgi:hypothetical protein